MRGVLVHNASWSGFWEGVKDTAAIGWAGVKGAGHAAVNTVVGLKNTGKVSSRDLRLWSRYNQYRRPLGWQNWRFDSQSNLGQASLQSGFSYGTHAAETGATSSPSALTGEGKAAYQLYKGEIAVDQASQTFGSTAVMQAAGAKIMQAQGVGTTPIRLSNVASTVKQTAVRMWNEDNAGIPVPGTGSDAPGAGAATIGSRVGQAGATISDDALVNFGSVAGEAKVSPTTAVGRIGSGTATSST